MISLKTRQRKRTPIGLDIGASGVRAVQITRDGTCTVGTAHRGEDDLGPARYAVSGTALIGPQLEASADIPGDANHANVGWTPPTDELARRIQSRVRNGQFRGHSVVAALNPPAVEFHSLEFPSAVVTDQEPDAADAVRWEVGRLMNEPLSSVETRHWSLPPTRAPAPNVIAVTARREAVTQMLKTCGDAGLQCICVDTGAVALTRLGLILNAWDPKQLWGVLDVGHAQARLVLCVDGVPVLVRRAGSGAHAWTERIAESLQLSVKAAEVHKRDHGIAGVDHAGVPHRFSGGVSPTAKAVGHPCVGHPCSESVGWAPPTDGDKGTKGQRDEGSGAPSFCPSVPSSPDPGPSLTDWRACPAVDKAGHTRELASMLLSALRSELKGLAAEVKRSYEYVLSCYPQQRAADLVLVGGGALMRNLPEFLSSALGIPVRRASDYLDDKSCRLRYASGKQDRLEVLASAIGLAIGH